MTTAPRSYHHIFGLTEDFVWLHLFTWTGDEASGIRRAQCEEAEHKLGLLEFASTPAVGTLRSVETFAREHPHQRVRVHFTPDDYLDVTYHPTWVEGTQIVFKHNGVTIDAQRAQELAG